MDEVTVPCNSRLYEMTADEPYVCDHIKGHGGRHRMVFGSGRFVRWSDMRVPDVEVFHGRIN